MTLILPQMTSISQQTPAKAPTLTHRATEPPIPTFTAFPRPERKAKENLEGCSKEENRAEHVFKNLPLERRKANLEMFTLFLDV